MTSNLIVCCLETLQKLQVGVLQKAKQFMELMGVLYTSTLCLSTEKSPTCGQIIPILEKLEIHDEVKPEDSAIQHDIKEKVWTDLSTRYKVI